MKITGPLSATLEALDAHVSQIKNLEENLISSLFQQFPTLDSFELEHREEYGHGSYNSALHLVHVNQVSWDASDDELEMLYLEVENPEHKAWLVETNLKEEEFKELLLALRRLNKENWQYDLSFKREAYAGLE